jgi:hypothetical protein
MVKKKGLIILGIFLLVLAGVLIYFNFFNSSSEGDFTKTSLVRLNIPLGGEINNTLKITNNYKETQEIKFSLTNFENTASLSSDKLILDAKESGSITLIFKDNGYNPGVYVGKLIIEDSFSIEEIPVVLGVEDPNHAFAIIQTSIPRYDSVYPGGKLGIDLKVFDLINSNVQTVKSNYFIKNLDGEVILNGETNLIVGTGSKTEIIDIPKSWEIGDYVFVSNIEFKNTVSFSSYLFSVSNPDGNKILDNFDIFLVSVIVFVILILFMVIYFVKTRDTLLVQLKKQQDLELRKSLGYIKNSKKIISESKEKPEKKKIKLRKLEAVKKEVVRKLKKKRSVQKKEFSKLKKSKVHKDKLKSKLDNWKKEGYKIPEADGEVKKITNKGIKEQMGEWNKKGYDTSFLNK